MIYEDVVEETEAQVRRLLAYLRPAVRAGLPALSTRTQRAVRTASSEQVRRPIYREGLDQWRSYAPQLGALRDALGDAVDDYEGRSAGR